MVSRNSRPDPSIDRGVELWRAALLWQRAMAEALAPEELTHVQYLLLACVDWLESEHGVRPTQRRLAEHAGVDPMMTSQVLRALERRGLLLRQPDPGDARARRLALTPRGRAVCRRAAELAARVEVPGAVGREA